MPRKQKVRRFDPGFHCVSQLSLEEEARFLHREVENSLIASPAELDKLRIERHTHCEQSWQHLCCLLAHVAEKDRRVLQALLFRDLWFVVELYRTYLKANAEDAPPIRQHAKPSTALEFSDFLFDLQPRKE